MIDQTPKKYKIFHTCDIGNQSIYVESDSDPTDAAIYCQMLMEAKIDDSVIVSNLGIASALVTFYNCRHTSSTKGAINIDMHDERDNRCGTWFKNNVDNDEKSVFYRDGLVNFLKPHLHD